MSAYLIVTQSITDFEKYTQQYIPSAFPFVKKYGGEILVADFSTEAIQGNPEKCAVVIKYPSKDSAKDFLNDKDYQEVKNIRLDATSNSNIVLADQFILPS